jgi:lipopolysaccharide assembly outer membrane protein LptD (OstA)
MKLLMLSVAMAALASQGVCQQTERPYLKHTEAPRLYFSMPPAEGIGRVELAASNAQLTLSPQANITSAEIESVLQLTGNVQVRMCAPSSHGCDKWSILLRADAVDYNEQTREINAQGNVRIEPPNSVTPH